MKLYAQVYERAGSVVKAARVGAHLSAWIELARRLGRFPTTVEVADHYGKSERQVWRWRAEIHEVFPGDEMERVVLRAAELSRPGKDPLRVEWRS